MKAFITTAILTLSFVASSHFAFAQDTNNTTVLKDSNYATPADTSKDVSNRMNMNGMKSMMNNCMTNNKDGKMCDQEMMTKCEEKMGQADCTKMMKKMKSAKMNTK